MTTVSSLIIPEQTSPGLPALSTCTLFKCSFTSFLRPVACISIPLLALSVFGLVSASPTCKESVSHLSPLCPLSFVHHPWEVIIFFLLFFSFLFLVPFAFFILQPLSFTFPSTMSLLTFCMMSFCCQITKRLLTQPPPISSNAVLLASRIASYGTFK